MLRIVIIVLIFVIVFLFAYKRIKKTMMFWTDELSSNDTINDRANKLKIEGNNLHEDLKEKEKHLKQEQKEIDNLKKKGF